MSELMEALIKSLIANGVKIPAEEPVCLGGDKVACGNELDTIFVLDFSEHDKKVAEEKDRKIAELERDLNRLTNDLKQNIGKINALREENKELKSQKKHIYIVGKEIDGQTYVKFEDFMSVVEELQESLVYSK